MVKKILLVEDDNNVRQLLFEMIKEAFIEHIKSEELFIFEARDGIESILLAEREQPDLIFLDIIIPKIDGFKVCSTIKKTSKTAKAHIIMLTGLQEAVQGAMAGADEYMTKPFELQVIAERVGNVLGIETVNKRYILK